MPRRLNAAAAEQMATSRGTRVPGFRRMRHYMQIYADCVKRRDPDVAQLGRAAQGGGDRDDTNYIKATRQGFGDACLEVGRSIVDTTAYTD